MHAIHSDKTLDMSPSKWCDGLSLFQGPLIPIRVPPSLLRPCPPSTIHLCIRHPSIRHPFHPLHLLLPPPTIHQPLHIITPPHQFPPYKHHRHRRMPRIQCLQRVPNRISTVCSRRGTRPPCGHTPPFGRRHPCTLRGQVNGSRHVQVGDKMDGGCRVGQQRFEFIAEGAIGYGEDDDGGGLDEVGEVGLDGGRHR